MIYNKLKDNFIYYKFKPLQQLKVESLSGLLHTSATPIRENLARLHAEDWVISIPSKGYFAKALSVEGMIDYYEVADAFLSYSISKMKTENEIIKFNLLNKKIEKVINLNCIDFDLMNSINIEFLENISDLYYNNISKNIIKRFEEHTRYVRFIEFEMQKNKSSLLEDILYITDLIEKFKTDSAINYVHNMMKKKIMNMYLLVCEANKRIKSS